MIFWCETQRNGYPYRLNGEGKQSTGNMDTSFFMAYYSAKKESKIQILVNVMNVN